MIRSGVWALFLGGLMVSGARAQGPAASDLPPPPPTPVALPARPQVAAQADKNELVPPDPALSKKRSSPSPAAKEHDPLVARGRFANPGGVGRYAEYYTPFTPLTSYPGQPYRVAGFGQGGGPSRSDQIEAFRVGQFRAQNIQNNINAYGRPIGFGYGYGYGIGFGRYGGYR